MVWKIISSTTVNIKHELNLRGFRYISYVTSRKGTSLVSHHLSYDTLSYVTLLTSHYFRYIRYDTLGYVIFLTLHSVTLHHLRYLT